MTRPATFVQIAASACDQGGTFVYALDANGDAWYYEWNQGWSPLNMQRLPVASSSRAEGGT